MTEPDHNKYQPGRLLSPEKQAELRDEALAKTLMKHNKAGYADVRLGDEILARDSKKTGYFPGRLVCKDNSDKPVPPDYIRIHYDGRPEGEFRDIPKALVYHLPDQSYFGHLNILLSSWVLLDDLHNFDNVPLLAYAKVFDRTDFRKIRILFDGSFELVDRKGRIAKVKSEWVREHSTVQPDAIHEAVREAQNHEQFLDLIYGGSHRETFESLTIPNFNKLASTQGPVIRYRNHSGQSNWLPAALASAIHTFAEEMGLPQLKVCSEEIYERGRRLAVNSKLKVNFADVVNQLIKPLGFRMGPLKFFNWICGETETPVVAFFNMGNGFGRCLSFTGEWVLDVSQKNALPRTSKELYKIYGDDLDPKAVWSYGLMPVGGNGQKEGGPEAKKNRRKRTGGRRNRGPGSYQQSGANAKRSKHS